MSEIVWRPPLDGSTNVERFMELHGIDGFDALLRKSVDDIDWFWDAVVSFLDLQFARPYNDVVDTSAGLPWATWFVGGATNVALSCVDRWRDDPIASRRPAVVWEGEDGEQAEWTYGELATQVDAAALRLQDHGVERGAVVGVFMPMLPETVAVFFALAKLGAVVLPLFSGFGSDAIAVRLNDAGASFVITAATARRRGRSLDMAEVARDAVRMASAVGEVMVITERGQGFGPQPVSTVETVALPSETPLLIAYTSGTTGRPKGSVHVHGGFLAKISAEAAFQLDSRPGDRLFWLADFGWIMGAWQFVGVLATGGTMVLYDGVPDWPDAGRMWDIASRHGVTILGTSPTLVRSLMRHGDSWPLGSDLSQLRILGSTGEPWNDEPWRWYFDLVGGGRCPVINMSGGTEVGACFLSPHPVQALAPMSLGGPALGMAVDVYDDEGRPKRDGVGELVCTRPWPGMTRGLWGAPERYLEAYWSRWPDVWVHGDWASVEAGQWYLHGRSDDTITIAGKRIGPAEVESVAVSHASVAEAAAFGMPDALKGEALWIAVVPTSEAAIDDALVDELTHLVASRLGSSFRPQRVLVVEDLPRTRSAKVVRRVLRTTALGEDHGDTSSLENPEILDRLRWSMRTTDDTGGN